MPINDKLDDVHARIYRIRGKQVMLDADLAQLYGVPTFRLNEQVKRNLRRFPPDFMFQLTEFEWVVLISQIAISKPSRGGRRFSPFVFTEQGVAMLSTVLHSDRAIQINIAIMRAFVKMRHAVLSNRDLARRVEKVEGKLSIHETDIRFLTQDIEKLKKRLGPDEPINPSIL